MHNGRIDQRLRDRSTFLSWREHVRAVTYNEALIVLNLRTDEYLVFPPEECVTLRHMFGKPIESINQQLANEFIDACLIEVSSQPGRFSFDDKLSAGAPNCSWSAPTRQDLKERLIYSETIRTFRDFRRVRDAKRNRNLVPLTDELRRYSSNNNFNNDPGILLSIASHVEACTRLTRVSVSCLEWAFAVASLAFRRKIQCTFVIGVQTHPFQSHAWIENNGTIIADSPDLATTLSRVLTI